MSGATSDSGPRAPARVCPWCSAPAPQDRAHCSSCGASLAQREGIDGLTIPGVTDVDPALVGLDEHRTIVTLSSERSGSINMFMPLELPSRPCDPETLGEPSEAATRVVELLEARELDNSSRETDAKGGVEQ